MTQRNPPPPPGAPAPQPGFVALRGPSGRLLAYLDPQRMVLEIKRKNEVAEQIDLRPYLSGAKD